jgi:hypothetical protein
VASGKFPRLFDRDSLTMMNFLTVDDCARLRGAKRKLLREFDHILRDTLAAVERRARKLDLSAEEVETACVTVMMSVAAGAALESAESPADVTDANFSAVARDALGWAKHKSGGLCDRRR